MVEAEIFVPSTRKTWSIGYNLLRTKFAGTVLAGAIEFNAPNTRALVRDTLPEPNESAINGTERIILYRLQNITVSIYYHRSGPILMFDPAGYPLSKIIKQLSEDI